MKKKGDFQTSVEIITLRQLKEDSKLKYDRTFARIAIDA